MQVDELLHLAGSEKLGSFVWGDALREVINTFLSKEREVTQEHTGNDAIGVLRTLPMQVLKYIGSVSIDPRSGDVVIDGADGGKDNSSQAQENPPAARDRPPNQQTAPTSKPDNSMKNVHSKIMLMIASALVFVMLLLTFSAIDGKREGGPIESSTLEVVVKTLGEVFKSTAQTAPRPDGSKKQDPYQNSPYNDGYSDPNYDQQRTPREQQYNPPYGN